jgi:hypothetical protein
MISLSHGILRVALVLALVSGKLPAGMVDVPKSNELMQQLSKESMAMLDAKDYAGLDKKAAELEKSQARNSSGYWLLRQFSNFLAQPGDKTDADAWKAHLAKLQAWKDKSGTAFSMSVLGEAQTGYGWSIRGTGYANTVKREQWKQFEEILTHAQETLEEAHKKDPKEVDVYPNLLTVGMGLGWPREKMDAIMKEAIAAGPGYSDTYHCMATALLERWGGKPGDWQRFVNSIPSLVPGDAGWELFAHVAMPMQSYAASPQDFFGNGAPDRINWSDLKRGFEAMNKLYPDGAYNMNRMIPFCCTMQDRQMAKSLLKTLDDNKALYPPLMNGEQGVAAVRKFVAGE